MKLVKTSNYFMLLPLPNPELTLNLPKIIRLKINLRLLAYSPTRLLAYCLLAY